MEIKIKSLYEIVQKFIKTQKFFIFASPWIIGFIAFTFIPMLSSLIISFTKWNILTPPEFIGLENYKSVFTDPLFYKSLRITLVYTFISVPINVSLALFAALLLNTDIKFINVYRTIYFLPAVVSGVVVSLLWSWIYNSEFGLINNFLLKFNIIGPRWLSDEQWIMPALIIMSIWGIGGSIIMYLSGLQGIPRYLYESAKLDGANWWTKFTKITLPSMSPIILFTGLTSVIGALQTFTQAYVMTGGGPNNSSLFYAFYVYKHAFTWKQMGKACALAWILFIVILLISITLLKVSKSKIHYESKDGGDIL